MNVAIALERRSCARGWSRRPAYRSAGGRAVTHGQVHALAARAAGVLAHAGVGPGDRVLLRAGDHLEWVLAFLGSLRRGAVPVAASPVAADAERRAVEADCAPALVLTDPGGPPAADGAPTLPVDVLARALDGPVAEGPVDPGPGTYVQYTSGTTGAPKGVLHSGADLEHHYVAVGEHVLGLEPTDVSLSISRLFFTYGFGNSLIYPLFSGSCAVLVPDRPGPAELADLVERLGVTVVHGVPSAWAAVVAAEDGPASWARSVRVAVSAGEHLPDEVARGAETVLGAPVLDELGSTELGGAYCAQTPRDRCRGTVGRPLPGFAAEVRAETSAGGPGPEVSDGEVGELWVAGPTLTTGYLGAAGPPDDLVAGRIRTGDLVRRDSDGRLRHAGRRDDVQMVGGIKVAPVEVEAALLRHAAVSEAAVVALPDPSGATKLRAAVVPAPDSPDIEPERLEAELLGLARRELAPFKIPRSVRLVPHLPRTDSGKLRRHLLGAAVA